MATSAARRRAIHVLAEAAVLQTSGREEYVTLIAEILEIAAFWDGHEPKQLAADAVAEQAKAIDEGDRS